MFKICFIHNLAKVDHFKFVSSRCYAPRAMFSCWLVNKLFLLGRIRKVSSLFLFSVFFFHLFFIFIFYSYIWAPRVGLDIAMGWGLKVGNLLRGKTCQSVLVIRGR